MPYRSTERTLQNQMITTPLTLTVYVKHWKDFYRTQKKLIFSIVSRTFIVAQSTNVESIYQVRLLYTKTIQINLSGE